MKMFLDCIPCFLKQALDTSRMVTGNEKTQKAILIETAKLITDIDKYNSSPQVAKDIHDIVKKYTNTSDPYKEYKKSSIKKSLKLYPALKKTVSKSNDPLLSSIKISAAGNVIDAAIFGNIDILEIIEDELKNDFAICDINKFKMRLKEAELILIIGDNTGESVFDRILAEQFNNKTVYFAARHTPIINDCTIEDAYASGLDKCTKIISSGCSAPGTIISECSNEFIDIYNHADIVISKGQGNYECLSAEEREIFFLLKIKCSMIAKDIGADKNKYVFALKKNNKWV